MRNQQVKIGKHTLEVEVGTDHQGTYAKTDCPHTTCRAPYKYYDRSPAKALDRLRTRMGEHLAG